MTSAVMQFRAASVVTAVNASLAVAMWLSQFGRTTVFGHQVQPAHLIAALALALMAVILDPKRWRFHMSIGVLVIVSLTLSMQA